LLAIRLAWGAILLECKDDAAARNAFESLRRQWGEVLRLIDRTAREFLVDEIWQLAWEFAYQRELAARLHGQGPAPFAEGPIEAQAVFCIDVRSEPMRRAIESTWPSIKTSGFAGFFGLPLSYSPLASAVRRLQLPGLLAPALEVRDRIASASGADPIRVGPTPGSHAGAADCFQSTPEELRAAELRDRRFLWDRTWNAVTRWPAASFSFVEAAGLSYVGKLFRWVKPGLDERPRDDLSGLPARYRSACRPLLAGLDPAARVDLAERVLSAMGCIRDFAPLVLLVGHGSQSANNAQSAALECGACGGQTGEVNARVLANLLNEPAVRSGLIARNIMVPEDTWFVAALHNTTTDEIEIFDRDLIPAHGQVRLERVVEVLAHAADQVRRERAPSLREDPSQPSQALLAALRRRANDGAETRPEWGLSGNAAFIIAPRWRSLGAVLGGRVFLHDYDAELDRDGSVLELLMTAPMLVTHWINGQYHASRCDPCHLGSGNKVLHNVVGGHLGIFEGNGGDLRIGLAMQSIHDGTRWMHDPLRLTVIIDAPEAAIEHVITRHIVVRDLIGNGWLHLLRWEGAALMRRSQGRWLALGSDTAQGHAAST
jgi:uncharacterized protein YbcC (UPF0753/DUF2309 family)